jgi:beta-lactamase regulating signal transducer with metallopeptidase domain
MNPIKAIIVTYVTNALWMTCVVALATSLLTRALRRCPSSYRHTLWVAALLLAVVLPFASVRAPRSNDSARSTSRLGASTAQTAETGKAGSPAWVIWRHMRRGSQPLRFGPFLVGLVALVYVGFVLYRAARLCRGWWALGALLRRSSEKQISPATRAVVEQCHLLLGMKPVPILMSLEGKGPATLGIRDPVLVLPEWFLSQASQDELSSTLCHELAHVRRQDFLLNLVYELLLLPISFHPAAALIKIRIDQTRELACDEIAAESLSTSTQYARSLLSIARSMAANQRPATAVGYALGLFDTNTLENRIMNILAKSNRIRRTGARASALATLVLLLVTCFGVTGFSIQVAQPTSTDADLQQFVGTWHAKFKGKTFLTILLEKQQGRLTGTASHGRVGTNDVGELTGAEELEGSDPIQDATLTNGILRITTKDGDSKETIQFEMKIIGANQAQIQIVIPPAEASQVPPLKPWKLERAKSGQ